MSQHGFVTDAIRRARGLPPLSSYPVDNFGLPIVPPAPAPSPYTASPSLASMSRSQVVAPPLPPPPPSPYTAPPPISPSLASISQASSGGELSKPAQDLANWINNDRLAVGASTAQIIVEMVNETKATTVAEFLTALTEEFGISLEEFSTVMEDAGITPKDMVEGANAAKLPVEETWIRETGANIGGFSPGRLAPPPEAPSPIGGITPPVEAPSPIDQPPGGTQPTGEVTPGGQPPGETTPTGPRLVGTLDWDGKKWNFDDQGNIFNDLGNKVAFIDRNLVIWDANGKRIGTANIGPDGKTGTVTIDGKEGTFFLAGNLDPFDGGEGGEKEPPPDPGEPPGPFAADTGVIKGWLDRMAPDFDKVQLSVTEEGLFAEESKNRKEGAIATLGRLRKRARQDLREELNARGLTLGEGSQIENRLGFFESDMAFLETQTLLDIDIDIGARKTEALQKTFDRELASFKSTSDFLLGVGNVWQTQEQLAQSYAKILMDFWVDKEGLSLEKARIQVIADLGEANIKATLVTAAADDAFRWWKETNRQIEWETLLLIGTSLESMTTQEGIVMKRAIIRFSQGKELDEAQTKAMDKVWEVLADKKKEDQEGILDSMLKGLGIGEFLSGGDMLEWTWKGVKLGAGVVAGGPAGGAAATTTMVSRAEPPPRTATVELPPTRPSLDSVTPTPPSAPALAPGVRQMTSASRIGQPSLSAFTQPQPPITTTLPSQPATGLQAVTGRTEYTGRVPQPTSPFLNPSLSMFTETAPTIPAQQKKPKPTGLAAFTKFL